ncbi:hypothetical protein [Ramlibacter sp. Leaf400]|uniref:hypothetical protein n=1 Tax=Ramlibacter sp. Leaf400 TaxID=1736365 RepID=UPI001F2590AA|nr:hypothetical protein [Ramlibacter sp. Leaf400]
MIVVYWLEQDRAGVASARHASFASDRLGEALKFAETLRARRREGQGISHVAIQSELPESVGQAGVADPSKDYAHYKRRLDPSVPLGRASGSEPYRGEEG